MRSLKLLVSAAALAGLANADRFIEPPDSAGLNDFEDNKIYEVGEEIQIMWETDLERVNILFWQSWPNDGSNYLVAQDNNEQGVDWRARIPSDFGDFGEGGVVVGFFAIYEPGSTSLSASSHYFNVTVPLGFPTTTSTTTSTSSSPRTAESTTSSTFAGFPQSTDSDENDDRSRTDSNLSTGAVVGISIGAATFGILFAGCIGYVWWKRHQRQPGIDQPTVQQPVMHEMAQPQIAEMPGDHPRQELPATPMPQQSKPVGMSRYA